MSGSVTVLFNSQSWRFCLRKDALPCSNIAATCPLQLYAENIVTGCSTAQIVSNLKLESTKLAFDGPLRGSIRGRDARDSQQLAIMKAFFITILCVSLCFAQEPDPPPAENSTAAPPTTPSTSTSEAPSPTTTSPAATVYTPASGLNIVLPLVTTTIGAAVLLGH
ncbi:hypothetical protein TcWFU_007172 [Taenia crassiceps]|uniref:Uncharacterized protein n=1 Tax=Taenia crassiceps TaxID=6207 RepID=A0ABR4Q239_9CEST